MSTAPVALDMGSILRDRGNRVVVCCGAGGVGKTTTAAAMAPSPASTAGAAASAADSTPVWPTMSVLAKLRMTRS